MPAARYRVPYEVTMIGQDIKSGKAVTNIFYYRSRLDTQAPALNYGDEIPGSSLTTFLTNVQSNIAGAPAAVAIDALSINFVASSLLARAIVGRAWTTPIMALVAVSPGLNETIINTAVPNGFGPGSAISIFGVTIPNGLNGNHVVTSIDTPSQFRIGFVPAGAWSGDGVVQKVGLKQQLVYSDREEKVSALVGEQIGDACPLVCSLSVRRINAGVGRNWKSRLSFGPIAESSQVNGKVTPAFQVILDGWLATLSTAAINTAVFGRPATAMDPCAVSKALAFTQGTPFVSSEIWCKDVSAHINRPNLGSMVRRKPRLTIAIAS